MSAEQLLRDVRARLDKYFNGFMLTTWMKPEDVKKYIKDALDGINIGDYMPSVVSEAPSGFDAREKALAAAREHVKTLTDERNSRGYKDYAVTAEKRIAEELRVARFLLGQED